MRYKLSDKTVRDLPAPVAGNKLYYDESDLGFAVRVTAAGARAFVMNYSFQGRERRITIGDYPAWSAVAAREKVRKLRRQIDDGHDPLEQREHDRTAPTVAELCTRYLAEHAEPKKRPKSVHEDRRLIDRFILPKLGSRKAALVRFADIDRLHREVTKTSGPYTANRAHSLLRSMYGFAIRWQIVAENPCRGVQRNQEHKRERFLTMGELTQLAEVLNQSVGDEHTAQHRQTCNIVRLLLLTGARKGETLAATWDQFDLLAGVWTKPGATTKQKTVHRIPLNRAAIELLLEIKAEGRDSRFVFPRGDSHQGEIQNGWESIRAAAGINDVRVHDLRHSYAAQLASAGMGLPVIGRLLGHTQAATTHRYAHLADDPLREATERVGVLFKAASSRKASDVVPIQPKKGGKSR